MKTDPDGIEETEAEMSSWAEDFHSAPPGERPWSAEEILAQASRDTRRERLHWASQVAGTLFAVAVFLGIVVYTKSLAQAVLSAVVVPTLLAAFVAFVHSRRNTWKHANGSVKSYVALAIRRRRADARLSFINRVALGVLAAAFWVWFPIYVLSRVDRFAAEPWRLAFGASVSLVIFAGAWWHLVRSARRTRAELDRWQKTATSLGDPE